VEWWLCSNRQWVRGSAPIGGVADLRTPYADRSAIDCPALHVRLRRPQPAPNRLGHRSPAPPPLGGLGNLGEERETGEDRRRKTRSLACAVCLHQSWPRGLLAAGDSGRSWTLLGHQEKIVRVEFRNSPTC